LRGRKIKPRRSDTDKDKKNHDASVERRRKVEHWVPPVWIPDSKTSSCMRCGRMFGWRRRRHHCRLCGRCVCAACSGRVSAASTIFHINFDDVQFCVQTFFITEKTSKDEHSSKPARACEACYETVFPLIDAGEGKADDHPAEDTNEHLRHNSDTITSMSHLPSWLSMPALPVQRQPQSLMAIDMNSSHDLSSRWWHSNRASRRRNE
jgi:FYVE/RhoGEF/PH domain-containing protein 5/6